MIPFWKLIHTNDVSTNLNKYVIGISVARLAEAKKSNIIINLKNPTGSSLNNINFKRDSSSFKLYLDWSPITTQDPVIVANLESISYITDNKGTAKLKIKALDKTGLFLSKLWSFSYTEQTPNPYSGGIGLRANEVIRNVIENSQDSVPVTDKITFNNVASTKKDGTAFTKDVVLAKTWKPLYEWIDEISSTEFTGEDRNYVYHLDEYNDLHWNYPHQKISTILTSGITSIATTIHVTDTSSYPDNGTISIEDEQITYIGLTSNSFTGCTRGANNTASAAHIIGEEVSGQKVQTGRNGVHKLTIDTDGDGEYTMIIYNSGNTPAGYDYLWYEIDQSRIGKQIKMKFYDWKDISLSTFNTEKIWTDPVTFYTWGDSSSDYPQPNGASLSVSNPWHPSWDNSLSITSNSEYQDRFIANAIAKGKAKSDAFFRTGREKFNGSVEMRGTLDYRVNEMITLYSPRHEITKQLRVKEVRHIIGKSGWSTSMSFTSDPAPKH